MSLFGFHHDFEDDLLGNHMNAMNMQMRSMNRLMNSLMPDPFNMLTPFDPGFQQNAIMERAAPGPMGGLFGFPAMPNMNRLLSADIGSPNGAAYCSSSVISMSSGPDGRPQIYQATSSTKTGPGGVRETRKTVQDSSRGLKKMAIGHHIGERSHIIEKEQDLHSGQMEERQEFINLDEDDAEHFDREFTNRARMGSGRPQQQMLTIEGIDDDDDDDAARNRQLPQRRQLLALPAPPTNPQNNSSSSASKYQSTSPAKSSATITPSSMTSRANATATNGINVVNHNNNNYLSTTPRRAYRSSHLTGAVSARRPLRTPTSSPLATTPTINSHITATSPSVHPHPYNAAAARRNYRAKHTKHHQQPQPQITIDLSNNTATIPATIPLAHAAVAETPTLKYDEQRDHSKN